MTSTKINVDVRGKSIDPDQRECVERLRSQAYKVQERFEIAERTALILEQMLSPEIGVSEAIEQTYEAHAFATLRYQLFRLLIIDICAAVLDKDNRTSSVRAILKELRRDNTAISALKAYYSDTSCLTVTVEGSGLDQAEIERLKADSIERHAEEAARNVDAQWNRVDTGAQILNSTAAKRLKWARNEVIAHYQKTQDGLVALDDDPPYGEGKLTWNEPMQFLDIVRPYVYDVFLLLTATSWDSKGKDIYRFYSTAFWDRFKNGRSDLQPGDL